MTHGGSRQLLARTGTALALTMLVAGAAWWLVDWAKPIPVSLVGEPATPETTLAAWDPTPEEALVADSFTTDAAPAPNVDNTSTDDGSTVVALPERLPNRELPLWPDELPPDRQLRVRIHCDLGAIAPTSVHLAGELLSAAAIVDGQATFRDLKIGWHRVRIEAPGFLPSEEFVVSIAANREAFAVVALQPAPTRAISFRVRDARNGAGVAGALVVALGKDAEEGTTDYSGNCTLNVSGPVHGYRVIATGYLTDKKFRLSDPLQDHFSVDLAAQGATVELQLFEPTDSSGSTAVAAYQQDGESWNYVNSSAANPDGVATLDDLPPGNYQFRFSRNGRPLPDSTLSVSVNLGEWRSVRHTVQ
ncbi:MAG: carboxypeptidase-like regulatory domain-containing protein [Planctomycetota bacterium]